MFWVNQASQLAQMVKNPPASAGDLGSIPGLGKFPGEWNGNPLQQFCLENSMDRGAQQATVHEVMKESDTAERWSKLINWDRVKL